MKELLTATLTAPTTLSCLVSGLSSLLSISLQLASIWTPTKYAVWNQTWTRKTEQNQNHWTLVVLISNSEPNHSGIWLRAVLTLPEALRTGDMWRRFQNVLLSFLLLIKTINDQRKTKQKKNSLTNFFLKEYKSSTCNLIFALCTVAPLRCIPSSKPKFRTSNQMKVVSNYYLKVKTKSLPHTVLRNLYQPHSEIYSFVPTLHVSCNLQDSEIYKEECQEVGAK